MSVIGSWAAAVGKHDVAYKHTGTTKTFGTIQFAQDTVEHLSVVTQLADSNRRRVNNVFGEGAEGNLHLAAVALWNARRLIPEDKTLSVALAELYNRIGRYEDAAELAHRVAKALPEWAEPHHILGTAYLGQGQTQKAIEEFEKFVQKAPDVAEGHHQLGNAYLYRGQKAEALAAFEAALDVAGGCHESGRRDGDYEK